MRHIFTIVACSLAALSFTHCQHQKPKKLNSDIQAHANMEGKSDQDVTGTIHLTQTNKGVMLVLDLKGLPPLSTHAFHVHEVGDCSSADAKTAGGHFNPAGHHHGGPTQEHVHAGDMGNIQSDAQGNIQITVQNAKINLKSDDDYSAIGRSLIIHADEDQFDMQPAGNAGSRISCGVIELITP